jgi:hypothetical protein
MEDLNEVQKPIGDFILENIEGINTPSGKYFHYSDVCNLLKLYKKSLDGLSENKSDND